jgi:hypothetical protein
MTDRELMQMALKFIVLLSSKDRAWFTEKEFEVVAALRKALAHPDEVLAEREACAKVCDLVAKEIDDTNGTATYCATSIRARGQK